MLENLWCVSYVATLRAVFVLTRPLQFTYINLAFAPAPDDTVANLYKV